MGLGALRAHQTATLAAPMVWALVGPSSFARVRPRSYDRPSLTPWNSEIAILAFWSASALVGLAIDRTRIPLGSQDGGGPARESTVRGSFAERVV